MFGARMVILQKLRQKQVTEGFFFYRGVWMVICGFLRHVKKTNPVYVFFMKSSGKNFQMHLSKWELHICNGVQMGKRLDFFPGVFSPFTFKFKLKINEIKMLHLWEKKRDTYRVMFYLNAIFCTNLHI